MPKKNKCAMVGQIMLVAVAVAVSALTYGPSNGSGHAPRKTYVRRNGQVGRSIRRTARPDAGRHWAKQGTEWG
jgi:hypothetical protein